MASNPTVENTIPQIAVRLSFLYWFGSSLFRIEIRAFMDLKKPTKLAMMDSSNRDGLKIPPIILPIVIRPHINPALAWL
jgi:hypothetical protein